jgi:hypothetical protein
VSAAGHCGTALALVAHSFCQSMPNSWLLLCCQACVWLFNLLAHMPADECCVLLPEARRLCCLLCTVTWAKSATLCLSSVSSCSTWQCVSTCGVCVFAGFVVNKHAGIASGQLCWLLCVCNTFLEAPRLDKVVWVGVAVCVPLSTQPGASWCAGDTVGLGSTLLCRHNTIRLAE